MSLLQAIESKWQVVATAAVLTVAGIVFDNVTLQYISGAAWMVTLFVVVKAHAKILKERKSDQDFHTPPERNPTHPPGDSPRDDFPDHQQEK